MKKLHRSSKNKKFMGVCGGVAEYFGFDATVLRLLMVVLAFCTLGTALIIYLIAALVMPMDDGYTDV